MRDRGEMPINIHGDGLATRRILGCSKRLGRDGDRSQGKEVLFPSSSVLFLMFSQGGEGVPSIYSLQPTAASS